jgi:hypothetical protein
MKTTIDIPEEELDALMKFTKARTKREAIVGLVVDFNRRRRMAALTRHSGTCRDLISFEELMQLRTTDRPLPEKSARKK